MEYCNLESCKVKGNLMGDYVLVEVLGDSRSLLVNIASPFFITVFSHFSKICLKKEKKFELKCTSRIKLNFVKLAC
jgi:hypothetical protein